MSFVHKGKERRVAPGTLTRHGDRWYLGCGRPRKRRAAALPRRPDHGDPAGRGTGHAPCSTTSARRAARCATLGVGPRRAVRSPCTSTPRSRGRSSPSSATTPTVEHRDDGSVVVTVGWGLPGLARGWVLSLLHHAEVLAPCARARRGRRVARGGPRCATHDAGRRDLAVARAEPADRRAQRRAAAARGAHDARPAADDLADGARHAVRPHARRDAHGAARGCVHGRPAVLARRPPRHPGPARRRGGRRRALGGQRAVPASADLARRLRARRVGPGRALAHGRRRPWRARPCAVEARGGDRRARRGRRPAPRPRRRVESAVADRRQLLITYYSASSDSVGGPPRRARRGARARRAVLRARVVPPRR